MGVEERENQGRGIGKRRGRRPFNLERKTKIKIPEVILLQLVTLLRTHIYNLTLQFYQLYIFVKSRRKEVAKY